jgi:hypothetical protein
MVAEEEASVEVAAEETGLSGIDNGGGDWRSTERWTRERRGLREFWDKSETIRGGLLFIGLKISAAGLN